MVFNRGVFNILKEFFSFLFVRGLSLIYWIEDYTGLWKWGNDVNLSFGITFCGCVVYVCACYTNWSKFFQRKIILQFSNWNTSQSGNWLYIRMRLKARINVGRTPLANKIQKKETIESLLRVKQDTLKFHLFRQS